MKNLKMRVEGLERQAIDEQPFIPALIYFERLDGTSTLEAATKDYRQRHGFDPTESIKIVEVDASKQYN